MALIYIEDNDPWIIEYDTCEKLFQNIMEQLTQRESKARTSSAFATLSANIRLQLKQYSDQIIQLKKKLAESLRLRVITADEAERRNRQIEILQNNAIKMKQLYDLKMNPTASVRPSLIKSTSSAFADGGTTGWGQDDDLAAAAAADDDDDDDPLLDLSVSNLKAHNENSILNQDRNLEELHKVITKQKNIAQTINNEVDHQNEIIDDLADHMERIDDRLIDGTRRIRSIHQKDRTCGYWIVIILLFISIITVALV